MDEYLTDIEKEAVKKYNRIKTRKQRAKDPEKERAYRRVYNDKNPDKLATTAEKQKIKYHTDEAFRNKRKEQTRKSQEKRKAELKAYHKIYFKKNQEVIQAQRNAKNAEARASKASATATAPTTQ